MKWAKKYLNVAGSYTTTFLSAMDRHLGKLMNVFVLICFTYVVISYFFWLSPRGFWFDYRDIKPRANVMQQGDVKFLATFIKYYPGDFEYHDTLFCFDAVDKEFHRFSQQRINDHDVQATDGYTTITFPYSAEVPLDTDCYLKSKIIDRLMNGKYHKHQTLDGEAKGYIFRVPSVRIKNETN